MLRETLKRNKGITLIALVVTIIVLLILAGISISMLTGQNGILTNASKAKNETGEAQIEEKVKLSVGDALTRGTGTLEDENLKSALNSYIGKDNYGIKGDKASGWVVTITENGKKFKIDSNGKIEGVAKDTGALPTGEGTTPYLPDSTFSKKEGDLATGLVIKDSEGNEYVWVEVPTTIYDNTEYNSNGAKKPIDNENYANIEACLKAYTANYAESGYSDTNPDFTVQYQAMLKSVYTNGGFWIGRYEAGLEGDTPRTSYKAISASDKAVVKPNKIPYNNVTRNEAQELATRMNYNGCTSSLMFGIQWDLTLKYIEEKTVELAEEANKDEVRTGIKSKLTSDSTTIGNYYNSTFTLNRGKFAQQGRLSEWKSYNSEEKPTLVTGSQKQAQGSNSNAIMLTTGATDATNLQNIYDIAGNVDEWTLEFYDASVPCVSSGGYYNTNGSSNPAKNRHGYGNTSWYDDYIGFRVGLWK